MKNIFIYLVLILSLQVILITVVAVSSYKRRKVWLALATSGCFIYSILPFLFTYPFRIGLTHPLFYECLFLSGNLLLIICTVYLVRDKTTGLGLKALSVISSLAGVGLSFLLLVAIAAFGSETLFKERIYGDFYLTIEEDNDNGMRSPTVTIENPLFIGRTISAGTDPWELPDKINFISFEDSILKFSVERKGKTELLTFNMRFDHADSLYNGVQVVVLDGKCGAIDSTGKIVIPLGKFQSLNNNYCGLMLAWQNNKRGFVDKHGNVVIDFIYDEAGEFSPLSGNGCDIATVGINKRRFLIDRQGKILSIDTGYDPGEPEDDKTVKPDNYDGKWFYTTNEPCGYYELWIKGDSAVLFTKEISYGLRRLNDVLLVNNMIFGSIYSSKGNAFFKSANKNKLIQKLTEPALQSQNSFLRNEYEERLKKYCK